MKPCIVTRGTMYQHRPAIEGYDYCPNHMPPHVWRQFMDARHQKIREDAMREVLVRINAERGKMVEDAMPRIMHDLGLDGPTDTTRPS